MRPSETELARQRQRRPSRRGPTPPATPPAPRPGGAGHDPRPARRGRPRSATACPPTCAARWSRASTGLVRRRPEGPAPRRRDRPRRRPAVAAPADVPAAVDAAKKAGRPSVLLRRPPRRPHILRADQDYAVGSQRGRRVAARQGGSHAHPDRRRRPRSGRGHGSAGLAEAGHECVHAADGEDGLEAAREGGFDVMVVDRMMPRMDGVAMVETLRREGDQTPVLFLSALGEIDDRVDGPEGRRRRLSGQALRLRRADRPGRGPGAPARDRLGPDPAQGRRAGDGPDRPHRAPRRARRSTCSRASSSCWSS